MKSALLDNNSQIKPWILIPAYQPTHALEEVVEALIASEFNRILLVNDGSEKHCSAIFEKLSHREQVVLLHHAVNLGKGAALKTGINYFLLNAPNSVLGLVTADADGQHLPEDIERVSSLSISKPSTLLMGAREFDTRHPVPLKSRLGNLLTRNIFGLLTGKKLLDTQTGLRYLPRSFMPECLRINSNGYEFELEMLLHAITQKLAIEELQIKTVYFDNNKHSHFNPFLDSSRIYFVFLRFISTSLATAFIDYCVFIVGHLLTGSILASLITARLFAGTFQFLVAKNWVFHSRGKLALELPSYITTVMINTVISYAGILLFTQSWNWNVIASKITVEGIVFSISFLSMRLLVFRNAAGNELQE